MDFLFSGPFLIRFAFAFTSVLGLIGLTAWLVRRIGRSGVRNQRGTQSRLAVVDATAVDRRRHLILVRRDNVEHLIMIGGPFDIPIEPNIERTAPTPRDAVRAPAAEPLPRQATSGRKVRNTPL
jgi:hypothetical protein